MAEHTTQSHEWPRQVTLPGQSHTAEGPHDQTGMYVMHHGFRRDLDHFLSAVGQTPPAEAEVWAALQDRWLRMAEVLHHHHAVEDEALWPVLTRYAEAAGNTADLAMLEDMEAEHGVIDPALSGVRSAFEEMVAHPCVDHRNALEIRVSAARESLHEHLAHEEGQALPMLQRTLSVEENATFEKAAAEGYPLKVMPFALCWAFYELPAEARGAIIDQGPPGSALLHRLLRRRFEKRERLAFRYA